MKLVKSATREDCFFCVRKHLAQAQVLLDESQLGYPLHRWLAVGHLAEAESEVLRESVEFASKIRETRIRIMGQCTEGDCNSIMSLLEEAETIASSL